VLIKTAYGMTVLPFKVKPTSKKANIRVFETHQIRPNAYQPVVSTPKTMLTSQTLSKRKMFWMKLVNMLPMMYVPRVAPRMSEVEKKPFSNLVVLFLIVSNSIIGKTVVPRVQKTKLLAINYDCFVNISTVYS